MERNNLYHHGIKGQKWGVRRFQNRDGTLTNAGKRHLQETGRNPRIERLENLTTKRPRTSKMPDGARSATGNRSLKEKISANEKTIKKVAAGTAAVASVAAAALYVHKNPEAIGSVISKFRGVKVGDISRKAVDKGKEYVKNAAKGAKEGIEEGIKEAPKKATKAVVTGIVMNQTKRALDSAVGKEESAKIFQANDNKKIAKFWKTSPEDKDDD